MTIEKYLEDKGVVIVDNHVQLGNDITVELESRTGNKIILKHNLSPYEWIYKEYMYLQKEYKDICVSFDAVFIIALLITASFVFHYYFMLLAILVVLIATMFLKLDKHRLKKNIEEFELSLESNKLYPDWEKSLEEYYEESNLYCSLAKFFLQLENLEIGDIKIVDTENLHKRICVKTIEVNGDVNERVIDIPISHYNINVKNPLIIMLPEKIEVKFPIDINKTGETDNQVLLTHED